MCPERDVVFIADLSDLKDSYNHGEDSDRDIADGHDDSNTDASKVGEVL